MDKNSFGRLMDHPGVVTPEEWEELRVERDKYPFSAPLQVLSLLADKANGTALWEKQALPRVALYMQQPDRLYEQLDGIPRLRPTAQPGSQPPVPTAPSAVSEARPAPSPTPEAPLDNDASFDVLQAINSYQEVSFKTAPKSVILSNFLEKDGGIELSESYYSAVPIQELAKKSISPNETLQTETLALVLEKQGKYAQALAMYEKLILNNPEKSSTFAVRIDALKTLLSKENNTLENK